MSKSQLLYTFARALGAPRTAPAHLTADQCRSKWIELAKDLELTRFIDKAHSANVLHRIEQYLAGVYDGPDHEFRSAADLRLRSLALLLSHWEYMQPDSPAARREKLAVVARALRSAASALSEEESSNLLSVASLLPPKSGLYLLEQREDVSLHHALAKLADLIEADQYATRSTRRRQRMDPMPGKGCGEGRTFVERRVLQWFDDARLEMAHDNPSKRPRGTWPLVADLLTAAGFTEPDGGAIDPDKLKARTTEVV